MSVGYFNFNRRKNTWNCLVGYDESGLDVLKKVKEESEKVGLKLGFTGL